MDESVSDNMISVIVPVYNSQDYLDACIDSISKQTYRNIEIIIVDDGSTDNSRDLCDAYATNDSRIHVIHKQNEGLVAARKTGIENAHGEYITFVDSDDYIDLDTYEVLIGKLDKRRPDMVLYSLVEDYPDRSCLKNNHFSEGFYTKEEINNAILPTMLSYGEFFDFGILPNLVCKLIRREFVVNSNMIVDECIMVGEDAAHTFQLIPQANDLMIIDYAPYHYCKRYDSMMWSETDLYRIEALKDNLNDCFYRLGISELMGIQLKKYISFVTLLKAPYDLLRKYVPFSNSQLRIALYGAGGMGQAVYNSFSEVISLWVDKNALRFQELNMPVKNADNLLCLNEDYDVVFIAILSSKICNSVSEMLRENGINKRIYYYDGEIVKCI